jgi:hypothetical protein
MKRFLIFAILGPPLGFVTLFWGLLGALGLALGEPPAIHAGQIVLLPMAYALGLAPALIAAAFDHALARWRVRLRILWTALFGYATAYLILLTAWMDGSVHGPYLPAFGLVGAVPGAICSWISSWITSRLPRSRAEPASR